MTRLVAVTGATGFLGRPLVRTLQADGWRVRALARRHVPDLDVEIVRGDLADDQALSALCEDADAVIHAAGLVKARTPAEFDAVNVEGARRVAHAARHVPHVVLVSSLVAREPALSHYSRSKRAGEDAMAEVLGGRLSVARPPAIYGPGDRELFPVFQAAARSPVLPIFDARARIAMIHVDDAAAQIAALLALAPGQRVALSDSRPEGYCWRELMETAARAVGRRPLLAPTPQFAVQVVAALNDFAGILGAVPMLTSAKARELMHPDWSLSPQERATSLPAAKWSLAEGFADAVKWYRTAAWMKQ